MLKGFRIIMVLAAVTLVLAGCNSAKEARERRIKKAAEHMGKIRLKTLPESQVFSLVDCIAIGLQHNLDLKVYELKERIADEKVTAQMLGMLPELSIDNQFHSRNKTPGSSSYSIETGKESLVSSRSVDNTINNLKIELALSVLDFGMAYLNSSQAEDRSLITVEQKRRAEQNLKLDIVKTYFKVAAAQDAIDITEKLLEKCKRLEDVFKKLEFSKDVSPLRLLDERKRFLRLEKRLMAYRRSYQNACIELRALMGYMPMSDIRVNTSCLKKLNIASLPDIATMEKIALVERPELYQLDIQTSIAVTEARKTILMMFPQVKVFVDFVNSNNSFLYTQSWWEIGVHAAYNLLKLPQRIAEYQALNSEIDEISMRTLALSIGIMAQVRIAHANIMEVRERYELDDRTYNAYKEHFKVASESFTGGGELSKLELDRYELETAETFINRLISMSSCYVAYYRLLNTLGVNSLDPNTIEVVMSEIKRSEAREKARSVSKVAQKQYVKISKEVTYNGIVLGNNTVNTKLRSKLDAIVAQAKSTAN